MADFLLKSEPLDLFRKFGGGKALNMARLSQLEIPVPDWFCVGSEAFRQFRTENKFERLLALKPEDKSRLAEVAASIERLFVAAPLPSAIEHKLEELLQKQGLLDRFVAVRSSGLDEDSAQNSFAGQFSSYLFQKGLADVVDSLKRCWASAYSERALAYRIERGLSLENIEVGVVVQLMVNAHAAGVAFSRNPMRPLDRDHLIVSSVWGLGEGLVSGELDADNFEVERQKMSIKATIVDKEAAFRQAETRGLVKKPVDEAARKQSSLSDEQVREVAKLTLRLEDRIGSPQDCEWAFEQGKLYCLQTRPITTLPPELFFDSSVNGTEPMLWDNSNIIESYSGVTSPLTFSFASNAYRQVYVQFCQVMGVPEDWVKSHERVFANMLGLLRGRVFYNLVNWYRLVLLLPGSSTNKGFMETMMGLKQGMKPEVVALFEFVKNPPKYSVGKKVSLIAATLFRFWRIDSIIADFNFHFLRIYNESRAMNFRELPLPQLTAQYRRLDEELLTRWKAPIINDYLCMIFFGLLKKLTESWVADPTNKEAVGSLQNDLLCGQGDLESTEPTKTLMRIADRIDNGAPAFRAAFMKGESRDTWLQLKALNLGAGSKEVLTLFEDFLDKYGFRCINELKLEESDLHDDPGFAIQAVQSYVRMKAYSIKAMEERELAIKIKAEATAKSRLGLLKRPFFFWILKQARRAVKNRENLRFARTKIFGVVRHMFRGVGAQLTKLGVLDREQDVFYLTLEEILGYADGRAVTLNLRALVELRRREFDDYRKTPPPPDRLLTYGAASLSCLYPMVLADADLLRSELPVSDDPNVLIGTSCCPGIVEGVVRVAHNPSEAEGLNGEILVTERTDPGWVPLYPSCSGLLIERGSLLSHSAVVARELGLPTIVGISGGLMKKLKTGMKVRVDAGRGEVRILVEDNPA